MDPALRAANVDSGQNILRKKGQLTLPQLGTLLRSKRKLEELSNVIQEQRRQTGH